MDFDKPVPFDPPDDQPSTVHARGQRLIGTNGGPSQWPGLESGDFPYDERKPRSWGEMAGYLFASAVMIGLALIVIALCVGLAVRLWFLLVLV